MTATILADASPEKRLFISLITRDISLEDAILDLIDNSINAAIEPMSDRLRTADDYADLLADLKIKPDVDIHLNISNDCVEIVDTAQGITSNTASKHVFKFGRSADEDDDHSDRLSVYGIGLKRAMFKLGERINMKSDHKDGGFDLDLNVPKWSKQTSMPWTFDITERPKTTTSTGTSLKVTKLYPDVINKISDGTFLANLKIRISRTYAFFLGRIVRIFLNKEQVDGTELAIGSNYASEKFVSGGVTCNITAGLALSTGGNFKDKDAGWFVFCNGRAIIFADKTSRTGWNNAGLPIFQPKHRPFLGTVFFVSSNPEELPWTTTKGSVNEESAIWQQAKRHMVAVGRIMTSFLDKRYTNDGTEIPTADLREASGSGVSVLQAAVAKSRTFTPPTKPIPDTIRIQYDAKVSDIERISIYLKRPSWSGAQIGRYTFDYFLKNEVKGE